MWKGNQIYLTILVNTGHDQENLAEVFKLRRHENKCDGGNSSKIIDNKHR